MRPTKKAFFEQFEAQGKKENKSISMQASDWRLIEAYRLYGASEAGHEISLQKLVREILIGHIKSDADFKGSESSWLAKLGSLKQKAQEGAPL